tara:strand:+ start:942 stop:2237 length:1296 start_codon:yes stop_codon:yes gene_type:complete
MSKTFCPLPWIHLATRPNGDVRVCCTANASGAGLDDDKTIGLVKKDGVNMNLRDHTIEEVWNSEHMRRTRLQMLEGIIPASCRKCFNEEQNGIVSKRQWETKVWEERLDIPSIVSKTADDGSLPVDIPYFDLRLGNVCQLKCIMCSPHDSSSWIKEWKIQYPKYNLVREDQGWDPSFDYTWYQKGSFIDTMKSQVKNIKELYFAGGEPLMIPEHYKILEFMVDSGHAENCIIRYNSNGLRLPPKLFALWEKFKEIRFNFSIDAYGDKNEYIRFPSKWNEIEENLRLLDDTGPNVIVNIASAVQLLNVPYMAEFADWKLEQNFKKINRPPFGAGIIGTHLVYYPSYLNVRVLPNEVKQIVKQRIDGFLNRQKFNLEFDRSPVGRVRWEGLVKYMMQEDWTNKVPALVEYLEITDKQRGLDFRKTFPELGRYV